MHLWCMSLNAKMPRFHSKRMRHKFFRLFGSIAQCQTRILARKVWSVDKETPLAPSCESEEDI